MEVWKQRDVQLSTNRYTESKSTQREFESVGWLNMNMEWREGMLEQVYGSGGMDGGTETLLLYISCC